MLAGSGTGVTGGITGGVTGGVPVGGAARVNAELTEELPNEPLRFRLAMTLAGDGSNANSPSAGVNTPRNSTVIDSFPLGATNWSVFWTVDAAKVPPLKEAEKLLGLTTAVGGVPPGTANVPIVTATPGATDAKLLVEPGCVVAFVTEKLVRVKIDSPVSFAPSEKASDPVIGTACAAPTQAKEAAASAAFVRVRMLELRCRCFKQNTPDQITSGAILTTEKHVRLRDIR